MLTPELQEELLNYELQWVAFDSGKLLAVAETLTEVLALLQDRKATVLFVPAATGTNEDSIHFHD